MPARYYKSMNAIATVIQNVQPATLQENIAVYDAQYDDLLKSYKDKWVIFTIKKWLKIFLKPLRNLLRMLSSTLKTSHA